MDFEMVKSMGYAVTDNKRYEGVSPDLVQGSGRTFKKARISSNFLPTYFGNGSKSKKMKLGNGQKSMPDIDFSMSF